jgi:hypothetical protein
MYLTVIGGARVERTSRGAMRDVMQFFETPSMVVLLEQTQLATSLNGSLPQTAFKHSC